MSQQQQQQNLAQAGQNFHPIFRGNVDLRGATINIVATPQGVQQAGQIFHQMFHCNVDLRGATINFVAAPQGGRQAGPGRGRRQAQWRRQGQRQRQGPGQGQGGRGRGNGVTLQPSGVTRPATRSLANYRPARQPARADMAARIAAAQAQARADIEAEHAQRARQDAEDLLMQNAQANPQGLEIVGGERDVRAYAQVIVESVGREDMAQLIYRARRSHVSAIMQYANEAFEKNLRQNRSQVGEDNPNEGQAPQGNPDEIVPDIPNQG